MNKKINKHVTATHFLNSNITSSSSVNDFDFPKPLRETFLYFHINFFSDSQKSFKVIGYPKPKSRQCFNK